MGIETPWKQGLLKKNYVLLGHRMNICWFLNCYVYVRKWFLLIVEESSDPMILTIIYLVILDTCVPTCTPPPKALLWDANWTSPFRGSTSYSNSIYTKLQLSSFSSLLPNLTLPPSLNIPVENTSLSPVFQSRS